MHKDQIGNTDYLTMSWQLLKSYLVFKAGCRTVSNNGSGSGLAPAQNILAVQVWFGFT